MKKDKALLVISPQMVLIMLTGCAGNGVKLKDDNVSEGLTAAQAAGVDGAPKLSPTPLSEIYLSTGENLEDAASRLGLSDTRVFNTGNAQTPEDYKVAFIYNVIKEGEKLINRSNWIFPHEASNKPSQNGLAYVWGGKTYTRRLSSQYCKEELYGLDCSGLIYQCALAAGVSIPSGNAYKQGQSVTWNGGLPSEWSLRMYDVVIEDGKYQTGDILGWGNHIGIVEGDSVIQSNGRPGEDQCQKNRSISRGPNKISISTAEAWFGKPKNVLRLDAGTWSYGYWLGQNVDDREVLFLGINQGQINISWMYTQPATGLTPRIFVNYQSHYQFGELATAPIDDRIYKLYLIQATVDRQDIDIHSADFRREFPSEIDIKFKRTLNGISLNLPGGAFYWRTKPNSVILPLKRSSPINNWKPEP